jgi:hypothetical protein
MAANSAFRLSVLDEGFEPPHGAFVQPILLTLPICPVIAGQAEEFTGCPYNANRGACSNGLKERADDSLGSPIIATTLVARRTGTWLANNAVHLESLSGGSQFACSPIVSTVLFPRRAYFARSGECQGETTSQRRQLSVNMDRSDAPTDVSGVSRDRSGRWTVSVSAENPKAPIPGTQAV